ncbi:MAG TPA: hypothetical protein VFD29_04750 [Gillisia sp.]|nr:hypothetical protein [Gillisia sp.]
MNLIDFPIAHDFNRGFNNESHIAMVSTIYDYHNGNLQMGTESYPVQNLIQEL